MRARFGDLSAACACLGVLLVVLWWLPVHVPALARHPAPHRAEVLPWMWVPVAGWACLGWTWARLGSRFAGWDVVPAWAGAALWTVWAGIVVRFAEGRPIPAPGVGGAAASLAPGPWIGGAAAAFAAAAALALVRRLGWFRAGARRLAEIGLGTLAVTGLAVAFLALYRPYWEWLTPPPWGRVGESVWGGLFLGLPHGAGLALLVMALAAFLVFVGLLGLGAVAAQLLWMFEDLARERPGASREPGAGTGPGASVRLRVLRGGRSRSGRHAG